MSEDEATRLEDLWGDTWAKWLYSADDKTKQKKKQLLDRLGNVRSKNELEEVVKSEIKELDRDKARHPKFWEYLNAVARSLEPPPSSASWGLPRTPLSDALAILGPAVHLMKSAASIPEIYAWIEGLFGLLTNFSFHLCNHIKAELPNSLDENEMEILGCFFDIMVEFEKKVATGEWKDLTPRAFSPRDVTITEAFTRLEELGKLNLDFVLTIMIVTNNGPRLICRDIEI